MKYLLIFFIVMVLVFHWRTSRSDAKLKAKVKPEARPGTPADGDRTAPQSMIPCAQCGLHIPAADAVQGNTGAYCSTAHLRLRET
jgi:uncharacterized protein